VKLNTTNRNRSESEKRSSADIIARLNDNIEKSLQDKLDEVQLENNKLRDENLKLKNLLSKSECPKQ
jgi:hypothetical protein